MRSQFALVVALLMFVGLCSLLSGWSAVVVPPAEHRELRIAVEHDIRAIALTPDGGRLAVDVAAPAGHLIRIHDVATGRILDEAPNPVGRCKCGEFSPDGRQLALLETPSAFREPPFRIHLFEISLAGKLGHRRVLEPDWPSIPDSHYPYHPAFSPDGALLAVATQEERIYLWDTKTGAILRRFQGGLAVAFAPDGKTLSAVTHDGLVRRFDTASWQLLGPARPARNEYFYAGDVVFSPDGRRVAIGDFRNVLVKDVATSKTLCRIDGQQQYWPRFFSFDSKTLGLGSDTGVHFFNAATGQEQGYVPGWPRAGAAGKYLQNVDDHTLVVRDERTLLAGLGRPPRPEKAMLPLKATLNSRRNHYTLDLEGNTPDDFSARIQFGEFPDGPDLDLVLELRNTSKSKFAFDPRYESLHLWLSGPGAINFNWPMVQTGVGFLEELRPLVLAPGEARRISITRDSGDHPFWLLPGKYRLGGNFHGNIRPAPPGSDVDREGFGSVWVGFEPIEIEVVADAKHPTGRWQDGAQFVNRPPPPGTVLPAPPPVDAAAQDARAKLLSQVNIDGFEAGTKLGDALEFLRQRYSLELDIDEAAFARLGKKDLLQSKVDFRVQPNMELHTILECLADPFEGTSEIRGPRVWIVPQQHPQNLSERLWGSGDLLVRQRQRVRHRRITLPQGIAPGTTLEAALAQVGAAAGTPILLDRRAFERRGAKNVATKPVALPAQEATLPEVLGELLGQVDARYVLREWIIVVTPAAGN
ncbi:MAG: WD40 repeat domain-containing protein [Gemmataceae bacterium]